jgi:hypothetical protein
MGAVISTHFIHVAFCIGNVAKKEFFCIGLQTLSVVIIHRTILKNKVLQPWHLRISGAYLQGERAKRS